jgi:tetratricopeptide (TPR) repeat protein
MHSALIGEAGKISALRIPGRMTANVYKNVEKSIPEIASEIDVDAVVETSVSCFGEQVCFQVAVVDAREDKQLWIKDYSVEISQIPNLLRILAKEISGEINVTLNPREEELLAETVTVNTIAYDFYMKGQYYLFSKWNQESFDSAMQYFERAKEIDPDFALAYTGICDVWFYRIAWGLVTPAEGNLKSMDALMKAYALDSNNAVVQYMLAVNRAYGMYDWEEGEAGFKKSISINPNHAIAHARYSHLLSILGRTEEALEHSNIALKLDPMNPAILIYYGIDLNHARKYSEAIKAFNNAIDLQPGYEKSLWQLWYTYYHAGRTEEAYATLKSIWSMEDLGHDVELVKYLEQGYLKDGFRGACLSLADRLEEVWTDPRYKFFNPTEIAILYSYGQETDKSIYWLEQSYQSRHPVLPGMLTGPSFDNVRTDPRFKELCQRVNLPHAAVAE